MTKLQNPLVHSHDHDHHHHHEEMEVVESLNPAQQSLADALKVSFFVLKIVMILLLLAYAASGVFSVRPQENAVRLSFGKIIGQAGNQVYGPGWHFGWPYPIEQHITVPTTERPINISKAYWFEVSEADAGKSLDQFRAGPLNPEKDGSLITGDANIAHGQWTLKYQIVDPVAFVENVGNVETADQIVANVAQQGIVFAIAQVTSDELFARISKASAARGRMQEVLDQLHAGIRITDLSLDRFTMPLAVRSAYQAVINAESERAKQIEQARQQRTTILNEAAGEAHESLFALLQEYEAAGALDEAATMEALASEIDGSFDRLRMPSERGGAAIGGKASLLINEALTDRTQIVEQVKADAATFGSLLDEYRRTPRIIRSQLWQTARESIFTGDVETIYSMAGQPYLVTNRDPDIAREREQQRLKQEQESVKQPPRQ
jgi:membrane protease subunit HflK